jgi:histidine triad (HIT) family protein
MKFAPPGYECPFCRIAAALPAAMPESAVVLVEPRVFAFIPLHSYGDVRGNCLIAPRRHYENVLDIPADLGEDFFRVTRVLASAMAETFGCEGISTRQHNGPAGDQDVWHFHLHLFPRFHGDQLWGGRKAPYASEERLILAERLRGRLAAS